MTNPRPTSTVVQDSTHDDHTTHVTTTVNVDALQLLAAVAGDMATAWGPGPVPRAYAAGVRDVLAWLAGNGPDAQLAALLDLEA